MKKLTERLQGKNLAEISLAVEQENINVYKEFQDFLDFVEMMKKVGGKQ